MTKPWERLLEDFERNKSRFFPQDANNKTVKAKKTPELILEHGPLVALVGYNRSENNLEDIHDVVGDYPWDQAITECNDTSCLGWGQPMDEKTFKESLEFLRKVIVSKRIDAVIVDIGSIEDSTWEKVSAEIPTQLDPLAVVFLVGKAKNGRYCFLEYLNGNGQSYLSLNHQGNNKGGLTPKEISKLESFAQKLWDTHAGKCLKEHCDFKPLDGEKHCTSRCFFPSVEDSGVCTIQYLFKSIAVEFKLRTGKPHGSPHRANKSRRSICLQMVDKGAQPNFGQKDMEDTFGFGRLALHCCLVSLKHERKPASATSNSPTPQVQQLEQAATATFPQAQAEADDKDKDKVAQLTKRNLQLEGLLDLFDIKHDWIASDADESGEQKRLLGNKYLGYYDDRLVPWRALPSVPQSGRPIAEDWKCPICDLQAVVPQTVQRVSNEGQIASYITPRPENFDKELESHIKECHPQEKCRSMLEYVKGPRHPDHKRSRASALDYCQWLFKKSARQFQVQRRDHPDYRMSLFDCLVLFMQRCSYAITMTCGKVPDYTNCRRFLHIGPLDDSVDLECIDEDHEDKEDVDTPCPKTMRAGMCLQTLSGKRSGAVTSPARAKTLRDEGKTLKSVPRGRSLPIKPPNGKKRKKRSQAAEKENSFNKVEDDDDDGSTASTSKQKKECIVSGCADVLHARQILRAHTVVLIRSISAAFYRTFQDHRVEIARFLRVCPLPRLHLLFDALFFDVYNTIWVNGTPFIHPDFTPVLADHLAYMSKEEVHTCVDCEVPFFVPGDEQQLCRRVNTNYFAFENDYQAAMNDGGPAKVAKKQKKKAKAS